jgi:hypothetical protein
MMRRSKKLLGSGDEEYFNEKRSVNVRVDGTAHLAELFPRSGDADEYRHHRGSVRMVGKHEVIPLGVQAGEAIQDCGFGVLEVWQASADVSSATRK